MSTDLPRLESRVAAQERLTVLLHARIEELSQDMTASFKQLAAYQVATEQKIDARFDEIDARFDEIKEDIASVKDEVASVKDEVASVKDDMRAMEGRILDAFRQLISVVSERITPPQF